MLGTTDNWIDYLLVVLQAFLGYLFIKRSGEENRIKRDIGKLYDRTEDNAKEVAVLEERIKNLIKDHDRNHLSK